MVCKKVDLVKLRFGVSALFILCFISSYCWSENNKGIYRELEECQKIALDSDRLSCFDKIKTSSNVNRRGIEESSSSVSNSSSNLNQAKDELGEKYLERSKAANTESVPVVIVSSKKDIRGRRMFQMENGQIWRQIEASYFPSIKTFPTDAVISPAAMDSYSLRVSGISRRTKVKRVK